MYVHDRHARPPPGRDGELPSIHRAGANSNTKKGRRDLLPSPLDLFYNLDFDPSVLRPALFRLIIGDRSRASISLYGHALAGDIELVLKVFLNTLSPFFRESLICLL